MTTNRITSSLALAGLLIAVSVRPRISEGRRGWRRNARARGDGTYRYPPRCLWERDSQIRFAIVREGRVAQRVTGWATVLSGIAHAATWVLAPIEIAAAHR